MSTISNRSPLAYAALHVHRLLSGLALLFPPLALVMLLGEVYLRHGGLAALLPSRHWLCLLFPGID
jgi:hypothetical protein